MRLPHVSSLPPLLFASLVAACASSGASGFAGDDAGSDVPSADAGASGSFVAHDGAASFADGSDAPPAASGSDAGGGTANASDASHAGDASAEGGPGYVPADPFTLDPTPPLATFAQLTSYFGPGATTATVGAFAITTRSRSACNTVTGCTPWNAPSPVALVTLGNDQFGQEVTTAHALPSSGVPQLVLDPTVSPATITLSLGAPEPGAQGMTILFRCATFTSDSAPPTFDCSQSAIGPQPGWGTAGPLYFRGTGFQADSHTGPIVRWSGRINANGTFHFVTHLAAAGEDVTLANNLDQIAIYGSL